MEYSPVSLHHEPSEMQFSLSFFFSFFFWTSLSLAPSLSFDYFQERTLAGSRGLSKCALRGAEKPRRRSTNAYSSRSSCNSQFLFPLILFYRFFAVCGHSLCVPKQTPRILQSESIQISRPSRGPADAFLSVATAPPFPPPRSPTELHIAVCTNTLSVCSSYGAADGDAVRTRSINKDIDTHARERLRRARAPDANIPTNYRVTVQFLWTLASDFPGGPGSPENSILLQRPGNGNSLTFAKNKFYCISPSGASSKLSPELFGWYGTLISEEVMVGRLFVLFKNKNMCYIG